MGSRRPVLKSLNVISPFNDQIGRIDKIFLQSTPVQRVFLGSFLVGRNISNPSREKPTMSSDYFSHCGEKGEVMVFLQTESEYKCLAVLLREAFKSAVFSTLILRSLSVRNASETVAYEKISRTHSILFALKKIEEKNTQFDSMDYCKECANEIMSTDGRLSTEILQ